MRIEEIKEKVHIPTYNKQWSWDPDSETYAGPLHGAFRAAGGRQM